MVALSATNAMALKAAALTLSALYQVKRGGLVGLVGLEAAISAV